MRALSRLARLERRRQVDYRASLHLIAPEGASHEIGE